MAACFNTRKKISLIIGIAKVCAEISSFFCVDTTKIPIKRIMSYFVGINLEKICVDIAS
jgi:hypothetical protein